MAFTMAMYNLMRSSKSRSTWRKYSTIGLEPQRKFVLKEHPGLFIKPEERDIPSVTVSDVLTTYALGYGVGSEYNPSQFKKIMKQFQTEYVDDYPKDQSLLPVRTMNDSFRSVVLNFDTNNIDCHQLKKQLLSFYDVFAVWLSYRHLDLPSFDDRPNPYLMISAFMDHISFTGYPIQWNKIVRSSSHVARSTSTTVEVVIESDQQDSSTGRWRVISKSMFRIAARDADLKKAIVNKLVGVDEKQDQYLQMIDNSITRRELFIKETSRDIIVPSYQELNLLNNLNKERNHPSAVSLKNTAFESSQFCDIEQRNRYYTTFGGFLITTAEEVGFSAATIFSKSQPELCHVGHGSFIKTVPLGSELRSKAMVASTDNNLIYIPVISEFRNPKTKESTMANRFHFVYKVPEGTNLPPICPKDDHEKLTYIMGRRYLNYIHVPN